MPPPQNRIAFVEILTLVDGQSGGALMNLARGALNGRRLTNERMVHEIYQGVKGPQVREMLPVV
jgi:hypothetical protein